jgi:hypothetical protein
LAEVLLDEKVVILGFSHQFGHHLKHQFLITGLAFGDGGDGFKFFRFFLHLSIEFLNNLKR